MLKEKASSKDTSPTKSGIKEKRVSRLGGGNPLVSQFEKAARKEVEELAKTRKMIQ